MDEIFVGTCPTHRIDIQRLKDAGFTSVLCLQSDTDLSSLDIDWLNMEEWYLQSEISVCRIPIVDFDDNDLTEKLPHAVNTLDSMAVANSRVLVHCTAGKQRSPATVIGHLAWNRGMGLTEAVNIVTSARNCAPPVHVLEAVNATIAVKDS